MVRISKKTLAVKVWDALTEEFPDSACSLDTDKPERLAIRGIMSAQCTDVRVNLTAKDLFEKWPEPEDIANASIEEIAEMIRPVGLTASKSKSVKVFAEKLTGEWGGKIPNDVDALMEVPGIGRKIANLIVGEIYGTPAIVVDTHCKRVMYRIGISDSKDPAGVEKDMMKVFEKDKWIAIGHLSVDLGREYCTAKNPRCGECPLKAFCRRRV